MSKSNKHSAFLIAAFVANALLNYGFSVTLSWFLSPEEFGVLGVAQSLLLLTGLVVGSGFAWTATYDIALSGLSEETRGRFRTAWLANTGFGVLLAGGLWFVYSSHLIPLGPDYISIILFTGLTTVLLAMRSVLNGVVRGLYWFGFLAVNLVVEVIVKLGVGLVLVMQGYGVPGVLIGFTCGTLVAFLHSIWILKPAHLWSGGGRFERKVLSTTVPFFIAVIGPSLILNLDILGLKLFAPVNEADKMAGLYQAAVILARTPVFIAQSLGSVYFSYAAGSSEAGSEQDLFNYLSTAARAWLRLLLPIALVLILAPKTALTIFYPALYLQTAATLQLAAAGGALLALAVLFNSTLQAAGIRFWPAIVSAVAVIFQIVVLRNGIPAWGITAAAASLFCGGLLASIGLIPAIYARSNFSLPKLRLSNLLDMIWRGLPFVFLSLSLLILPGDGRAAEIFKALIAGSIYCLALLITHPLRSGASDRPIRRQIVQLVNVLLGGGMENPSFPRKNALKKQF